MKSFLTCATSALLVGQALAHPLVPSKREEANQKEDVDTTVLQLALSLEHLENDFYRRALDQLSQQQFVDAGYDPKYYPALESIAADEATHVEAISNLLTKAGVEPVMPCEYDFPFSDVPSFITLSSVLEGVGTSAYLGAAGLITSDETLTIAGSILAVEALHTSIQRAARKINPFANPFYTPLNPSPVVSLAASFIQSCPQGNFELPFETFPELISNADGRIMPGAQTSFSFDAESGHIAEDESRWITFVSGLNITSVSVTDQLREDGGSSSTTTNVTVEVPASGISGQSYAFLTSEDVNGGPGALSDDAIVNGPAIIEVGLVQGHHP